MLDTLCRANGWSLGASLACTMLGCDRGEPTESTSRAPVRVASLSPALSDTLLALDCGAELSGRTPWCAVDQHIPVVGTLLDIDAELLTIIDPDVVLVQPPSQGAPAVLAALGERHGWQIAEIHIDSLEDVRDSFARVAQAIDPSNDHGCATAAEALQAELQHVCSPIDRAPSLGRVALVSSVSDAGALAFGAGSFPGDAVRAMGVDLADMGAAYLQLSREDLARVAPRVIVVIGGVGEAERWAHSAPDALAPGATIVVVEEARLLQPGASLVQGLAALRSALEGARP